MTRPVGGPRSAQTPRPALPPLPPGAVDAHAHVFRGSRGLGGEVSGARYAPPDVGLPEYLAHLAEIGCERGVLVQPSAYGTEDHDVLLEALAALPGRLRGVACVPPGTDRGVLARLHEAGVRATRVQDGYPGGVPVEAIGEVARMVADLGWHIELWSDVRAHAALLAEVLADPPAPIVIDHLGYVPSSIGVADDPALAVIREALARGRAWVCLSGLDRLFPGHLDPLAPGFAEAWARHENAVAARVATLVAAGPEQLIWGSDWPHVGLEAAAPTARMQRERLARWLPDPDLREWVLVDNPTRLYDF